MRNKRQNIGFWILGILAIVLIIVQIGHFLDGHFQKMVRGEVVRQGQHTEQMIWDMTERINNDRLTASQRIWEGAWQIEYLHSFDHKMAEQAARRALGDFSLIFGKTLPAGAILKNQEDRDRKEARKAARAAKKAKKAKKRKGKKK